MRTSSPRRSRPRRPSREAAPAAPPPPRAARRVRDAGESDRGRDAGAGGGLHEDGRLHAVPDPRAEPGPGSSAHEAAGHRLHRRSAWVRHRAGDAVVLGRRPLPDQRRGAAARELAVVYPDHLRADGPVRGARGRPRDARLERAAPALPPGLLRPPLRAGVARSVLPRDRVPGPEVRHRRDRRVPQGPRSARGQQLEVEGVTPGAVLSC
jgi:hypothetical protein